MPADTIVAMLEREAAELRARLAVVEARIAAAQQNPSSESLLREVVAEAPYDQQFLTVLFDNIQVGISLRDRHGGYLRMSRFLLNALGYHDNSQIYGRMPAEVLPAGLAEQVDLLFARVMRERALVTQTYHAADETGARTSMARMWPLFDAAGEIYAVCAISVDTTEGMRYEQALRESEQRFRSVWEATPDALAMSDADGIVVAANPAYYQLYGLTPEQVIGKPFTIIYPEERRALAMQGYRNVFDAGVATPPFETQLHRPDGTVLTVESRAQFVRQADGRMLLLSTIRDISARRNAEEERLQIERKLREAQRLESLGVLAGGIAHDFNNLLTGISGNTELALLDIEPSSPAHESLVDVLSGARRAADLVSQIMAYAGQGQYLVHPIDVNHLIRQIAGLLHTSAGATAVLQYEFAEGLPMIEGDTMQLRQVLINLVTNAAEAIEHPGGTIVIATSHEVLTQDQMRGYMFGAERDAGAFVAIAVSDTGHGMERSTIARIFDPFYTTKFAGRGLGLAAVQGIVRSHSGLLAVESDPGRGTTVKIWLPVAAAVRSFIAEPIEVLPATQRVVMIVDDEEAVRLVSARLITRLGLAAVSCADGESALEQLRAGIAGLAAIMLDVSMLRMHGDQAAREINALCPEVPVVLMSGYSAIDIERLYPDLPFTTFLQKPFSIDGLRTTLELVMRVES
jgi:PAS domain S-box-containing protein